MIYERWLAISLYNIDKKGKTVMGYIEQINDNVFFKRNIDFKYISIPSISKTWGKEKKGIY